MKFMVKRLAIAALMTVLPAASAMADVTQQMARTNRLKVFDRK